MMMNMINFKIREKTMISSLMTTAMVIEILAVKYGKFQTPKMKALKRRKESSM
jgi:hypothetical protein